VKHNGVTLTKGDVIYVTNVPTSFHTEFILKW